MIFSVLKTNDFHLLVNYRDLQCGKLICKYHKEFLVSVPNASTIYTNVQGDICIALEFPHDYQESPKMWVKDGTTCGKNKVCSLLFPNNFLTFYILFLKRIFGFSL